MKEIVLSDFTGDQIRSLESERRGKGGGRAPLLATLFVLIWTASFAAVWWVYDLIGMGWQNSFWSVAGTSFWPALLMWFIIGGTFFPKRGESNEEHVWRAGKEGEDRVAATLRGALGDEWTLIRGYRNRGGEIDQVLVGPSGVIAIEVKYVNGVVNIAGDRWTRDRYDNYGNLQTRGESMADKGGRSPSAQLNASANRLQGLLANNSAGVGRVSRAVILSHDKSAIGNVSNPSVDFALTLADMRNGRARAMFSRPARFNRQMAGRIVNLIAQDHRSHNGGGGGRKSGGGRRRGRRRGQRSEGYNQRLKTNR